MGWWHWYVYFYYCKAVIPSTQFEGALGETYVLNLTNIQGLNYSIKYSSIQIFNFNAESEELVTQFLRARLYDKWSGESCYIVLLLIRY